LSDLPEFLQDQTEENIRERMLARLPTDLEKVEGSPPYDALAPVAIELTLAAEWAKEVLRRGFAQTTFGTYLDMRCEENGMTRLPAVPARTPEDQIKVTGSPGVSVPAGRIVSTESTAVSPAILFKILETITLDGTGQGFGTAEAVVPGKNGNVPIGAIKHFSEPIDGVQSITNLSAATGGLDVEDDASLLNRYLQESRAISVGGNKSDYKNWAMEVPGVGNAFVIPRWDGAGTVKVVILGADKLPASVEVVSAVQDYIDPVPGQGEGKAPIGAFVTVEAAAAVNIDVSASLVLDGVVSLPTATAAFESALVLHLQDIAFSSDTTVKYVRIGAMLLEVSGVQDYSDLLINGGTSNIPIDPGEVAVKGTVTLT
jgi:uncharacterized phage protein gp47/JayE